jgi:hypothetical protein
LAERPQWLVWRFEDNGEKKPRKVPYYTANHRRVGEQGTPQDREKLRTLDQAITAAKKLHMDGVGFAFLPGDGLIGIDIDGAIDIETGEISERARTSSRPATRTPSTRPAARASTSSSPAKARPSSRTRSASRYFAVASSSRSPGSRTLARR